MTDYTDLIARLRMKAQLRAAWLEDAGVLEQKAADAIEALQAEVARLREQPRDVAQVVTSVPAPR